MSGTDTDNNSAAGGDNVFELQHAVEAPKAPDTDKSSDDANPKSESEPISGGHFRVTPVYTDDTKQFWNTLRIEPTGSKVDEVEIQLKSDIESTITTLLAVFARTASPGSPGSVALTQYLQRLYDIAVAGLEPPGQPRMATVALKTFRDDVLSREGARVKNGYMKKLGHGALLSAAGAIISYFVLTFVDWYWNVAYHPDYYSLCWLWAGAMGGCWLSFGIRRVEFDFADLGRPESDMLEPALRLLFVGLLAAVLALVFKTGMLQITIGKLDTNLISHPSIALLIGLFCGIGEQTLPSTIGKRASQFLGEVAK